MWARKNRPNWATTEYKVRPDYPKRAKMRHLNLDSISMSD